MNRPPLQSRPLSYASPQPSAIPTSVALTIAAPILVATDLLVMLLPLIIRNGRFGMSWIAVVLLLPLINFVLCCITCFHMPAGQTLHPIESINMIALYLATIIFFAEVLIVLLLLMVIVF